jgi:ABC-type bacteriocin/lantibiotic exporter with double-glycine peptidase domain
MMPADFRQTDEFDCGAAVVYTAALSFGIAIEDYESVLNKISTKRKGAPPFKLIKYLKKLNFKVKTKQGITIDRLRSYLDSNSLVIAPIKAFLPHNDDGHWVLIYKVTPASICFHDPWCGKRCYPIDKFYSLWYDTDCEGKFYRNYGIIISV